MSQTNYTRPWTISNPLLFLLAAWFTSSVVIAQEPGIRAGGIEFVFATAEQGRALLKQEDAFVQQLSSFDRQVRMQTQRDPGKDAFLAFVAGEVSEWRDQDRAAVRKALTLLDSQLGDFKLPKTGPVLLVHTTGREESNAAYTRGSAIVLPTGKTGTVDKPAQRRIAHELFHVLSRNNPQWRDRLYSIIGFNPISEIRLPDSLADRRITNPDAPQISHAIRIRLASQQTVMATPVLIAKSEFDPGQRSLFRYIDFKLMEVKQVVGKRWIPHLVDGEPVLHDPSIPDYHRQIGGNTKYIIHPDEILADNFVALVTGAKVKDQWVTDKMRAVFAEEQ